MCVGREEDKVGKLVCVGEEDGVGVAFKASEDICAEILTLVSLYFSKPTKAS